MARVANFGPAFPYGLKPVNPGFGEAFQGALGVGDKLTNMLMGINQVKEQQQGREKEKQMLQALLSGKTPEEATAGIVSAAMGPGPLTSTGANIISTLINVPGFPYLKPEERGKAARIKTGIEPEAATPRAKGLGELLLGLISPQQLPETAEIYFGLKPGAGTVKAPSTLPGWDQMTAQEKAQRIAREAAGPPVLSPEAKGQARGNAELAYRETVGPDIGKIQKEYDYVSDRRSAIVAQRDNDRLKLEKGLSEGTQADLREGQKADIRLKFELKYKKRLDPYDERLGRLGKQLDAAYQPATAPPQPVAGTKPLPTAKTPATSAKAPGAPQVPETFEAAAKRLQAGISNGTFRVTDEELVSINKAVARDPKLIFEVLKQLEPR